MKKSLAKSELESLLAADIEGLSETEKYHFLRRVIADYEAHSSYDQSNSRKPWSDEELFLILSTPPTKENTIRLAKAFKRGYGSIEQIFRWAGQSEARIKAERGDDSFVQQIKRVRSRLGWRSVGGSS
ncbi:hypothetical protein [Billgrantia gudaonensis]|uniref:hypothetical protein n=1 Tax=Billgrantia gudaonensis TaxID=376427 RepID=UPI000B7EBDC0|nr:hypothetical protein [Halomonas gudaonensis]